MQGMSPLDLSFVCRYFSLSHKDYEYLKTISVSHGWSYISERRNLSEDEVRQRARLLLSARDEHEAAHTLYPEHPGYPQEWRYLEQPPVCVHFNGDLGILHAFKVSVVGSRNLSFRFNEWAECHLTEFLRRRDVAVVSGGAYGADQKASNLALMCARPTVLILPSGLGQIYPSNISDWKGRPNVLMMSEYGPQEPMRRHHFVVRNRLISSLGEFLVVLQAAIKSGTMITARYAIQQGKEVATLPDFPNLQESGGNLQLLRDGAQFVQGYEDLMTMMDRRRNESAFQLLAPSPGGQDEK